MSHPVGNVRDLRTHGQPQADEHPRCRALRHAWVDIEAESALAFRFRLLFRCERCATLRRDIIDRRGNVASRSRQYPCGYPSTDKLTARDYRLRLLTFMRGYVRDRPRRARRMSS